MCERHGDRPVSTDRDPAPAIRARSKGAPPLCIVAAGETVEGRPRPMDQAGPTIGTKGTADLVGNYRVIGGGRNPSEPGATDRSYRDLTDEPSTTIAAVQIGNAGPWVVAAGETGEGRPRPMDQAATTIGTKGTAYLLRPAPTVRCGDSADFDFQAWCKSRTGRRRLTVEECARLQDFPPVHPFQGTKTAQYRQVGNAVPPTLARVVAARVYAEIVDRLRS
jgi:site-specific DNA-cytosine methylase